jgi:hypothetical protein
LVFSRQLGAFFFLQFSLHEFAPCDDIESFQTCIKGNRPHWASNDLVGHWCFESALAVQGCAKQATLDGFQAVIRSLWRREDFADEPFFFAVDGPYVRGTSDAIKSSRGEFLLNSDKEYAVNIFHFHPDGDEHPMPTSAGILKVDMAAEQLKSVTRPTAQIESPYDLKTFYFRTSRVMRNESASIVFSIECNSGGPLESQPEIFLPMKIKPSWFKNVVSVVLIAGLLFFQQFLSATAKGPIGFSTTAVLLLLAIATALIVVFGLQKQV